MIITKPTLLLDKEKCLQNISLMAEKAKRHNLIFRPHFKTHQSRQIGEWFRQFGVDKITVSSVQMAEYFAQAGWNDITIAFPFNQLEMEKINHLAAKINLNILLIHPESVSFLAEHLKHELGVFIEIDCGHHRSGILAENSNEINILVDKISDVEKLKFKGLLTHSGETYNARSPKQIHAIHEVSRYKMKVLKERYLEKYPEFIVSIGDTPSCTLEDNFQNVDEIRPGNFVFYDVMQLKLGVCKPEDIAVAVACPIISKSKARNELIVYGGAVHLSKEYYAGRDDIKKFGLVAKLTEKGWSSYLIGIHVSALSQEHGTIKVPFGKFNHFKVGEVVAILPVHSCLTANLMGKYLTLEDEEIDHM